MSGGGEHDERDEAVVLLTSLASAFEAEVVVALLRSNDITATTSGGKGYAYFHRADCPVFVLEHDLDRHLGANRSRRNRPRPRMTAKKERCLWRIRRARDADHLVQTLLPLTSA